ncbi:F-box domain-containing protein [Madurella fahalii]|uniref:F-box domain-containing protein n=1 Tax=Madurella fahalii TaxID=1157608 RepID=A0ABQ0G072_9PEZI
MGTNDAGPGQTDPLSTLSGDVHARDPAGSVGLVADRSHGEPVDLLMRLEDSRSGLEGSPMVSQDSGSTAKLTVDESIEISDRTGLATKRKSPDDRAESDLAEPAEPRGGAKKKMKLGKDHAIQNTTSSVTTGSLRPDKSLLSPEVWHHIFTFLPPQSLGNLLAVNKLFNIYLDPASSVRKEVPPSVIRGVLSPLKPNAIWQASRRFFWPQMPAPIRLKTELEMWRLACSHRCQHCGRLHAGGQSAPPDPKHPGPGQEGVAAVWAFGSRMCGPCLIQNSVKEVDLLLSASIPSAVLPALPFIFLTQELHVYSATMLEQGQLPIDQQVTKRFSSSDVEALTEEFLQVKDMGQGTAGEWLKGLAGRGKDMQQDASKWEKWECSGGIARMCSQLYPGYVRKSPVSTAAEPSSTLPVMLSSPPVSTALRSSLSQARHERTAEEVAELKAARKAEIERRALLLDPPLTADVLRHIPSFQAATHIVAPLDDNAWELLKPRLLAQRADAETQEGEITAQAKAKQGRPDHGRLETTLASTKEARDRVDKDWEEVQAPLRAKIAGYADEVIQDGWGKCKKVTRENCSRFAIDVLVNVRRRFYAEVAKDVAAARAAGETIPTDPPEGPFTQKLTLENMKWIFDTKIRPHTEALRKELFYCSGCEGNYKTFGFEGVIQHYAAKHTNALSVGNVVVHWRAEWPEHSPFSAEVRPAKPSGYPYGMGSFVGSGPPPPASYNYPPAATAAIPSPVHPPSIGYGYGVPTYHDHYQQQPPPLPPQPYHQHPPVPPFAPQPAYEPQPSYVPPPAPYQPYPPPAAPYPPPVVEVTQGYVSPQSGQYDYNYGSYHANSSGTYAPPQVPTYPDLYKTKLEDIARNSREIWRLLGDIKDLPGAARVFVTIHHLVKRFRSRFYETPPLAMFIDGLSNNKEMRPVRNVNGLICKACHLGLGNAASVEQDRKYFSLPQLANHFQSKHVEPMQRAQMQNMANPLDWVVDMVSMPDLSVISSLTSSLNETQRSLLTAALPSAFGPQRSLGSISDYPEQVDHRNELARVGGSVPIPGNARDERYRQPAQPPAIATGHATSHNFIDKYSVGADSAAAGFLADSRSSAQSPTSGTPATMSESEGGRHSSQGSRQNRGQSRFQTHRKGHGKNKHAKTESGIGSGDRMFGKPSKTGGEMAQRDEADVRAMSDTHQIGDPRRYSSSAQSILPRTVRVPETRETRVPTQPAATSSQDSDRSQPSRNRPIPPASTRGEPDIMAALELRLEQRLSAPSCYPDKAQRTAQYMDSRGYVTAPDLQYTLGTYAQLREREDWAGSPTLRSRTLGSRYHDPRPAGRDRSPSGRQFGTVYYSTSGPVGRREERCGPQLTQRDLAEPPPRHTEEARFSHPPPRPEDDSLREAEPPSLRDAERYHYRDGATTRLQSRPTPVEAYEIVQVIDEHGEYYIRRPARREQRDARYVYEERRVLPRDASPHPHHHRHVTAHEPVYVSSRPNLAQDGGSVRASMAPEGWAADRRADPAYYEEYDPRFPAA